MSENDSIVALSTPLTSILKKRCTHDTEDPHSSLPEYGLSSSRRVRFTSPLVTKVFLRPRTKRKHKANLFYTGQEYQCFRAEYRTYLQHERAMERERARRESSTLNKVLSFASSFISGIEATSRSADTDVHHEDECFEDEVQSYYSTEREQEEDGLRSPAVTASELYDVLYLY